MIASSGVIIVDVKEHLSVLVGCYLMAVMKRVWVRVRVCFGVCVCLFVYECDCVCMRVSARVYASTCARECVFMFS